MRLPAGTVVALLLAAALASAQSQLLPSLPRQAFGGSVSPAYDGWYAKLFYIPEAALEVYSIVADVHTQPTDEGGNPVGHVLHVGTGAARLMVVVTEGCSGPRAYAGLASSYYEKVTDDFERLTDEEWAAGVYNEPDPAWLSDVVK